MKLQNKFIIPTTIAVVVLISLFSIYQVFKFSNEFHKTLLSKAERTAKLIALANSESVWNYDDSAIGKTCKAFFDDEEMVSLKIEKTDGTQLIDLSKKIKGEKDLLVKQDIIYDEKVIAKVSVTYTDYYQNVKIGQLIKEYIFVTISISLIIIAIIFIVSIIVTAPIKSMLEVLDRVCNKDLTVKVAVKTKDEISSIGTSINQMIDMLSSYVKASSESATKLSEISEHMAAASEENFSSIDNVKKTMLYMQDDISDSVKAIQHITHMMKEMEQYVSENEENSEKSIIETNETIDNVKKGVKTISELYKKMESVKVQVNTSSTKMEILAELLIKIDNFSQVITNISSQTNLLALNAAIEAAKAGDSGRGFAVVAAEVKKLALESEQAAEQIVQVVNEIREEASNSVIAMKNSYELVNNSVEDTLKTKALLDLINNSGENMQSSINNMLVSIKSQNTNQRKLKQEIDIVNTRISNNYDEVVSVAIATNEQIKAAKIGMDGANEVVESTEGLSILVSQFKVLK